MRKNDATVGGGRTAGGRGPASQLLHPQRYTSCRSPVRIRTAIGVRWRVAPEGPRTPAWPVDQPGASSPSCSQRREGGDSFLVTEPEAKERRYTAGQASPPSTSLGHPDRSRSTFSSCRFPAAGLFSNSRNRCAPFPHSSSLPPPPLGAIFTLASTVSRGTSPRAAGPPQRRLAALAQRRTPQGASRRPPPRRRRHHRRRACPQFPPLLRFGGACPNPELYRFPPPLPPKPPSSASALDGGSAAITTALSRLRSACAARGEA